MTTVRWTRLLGACAALTLIAAACGDDDTAVTAESATESTAESATESTAGSTTESTTESTVESASAIDTATAAADTATTTADDDHADDTASGDHDHADDTATDTSTAPAVTDADGVIDVAFVGGEVEVDDDRIAVDLGSEITLEVTSDVAEHVHVHGYDLFADVAPDAPAMLTFTADVPGLFEIEFEDSVTFIAELEVR